MPPSRRGGEFKSRAEGETIPTLANAKEEKEEVTFLFLPARSDRF